MNEHFVSRVRVTESGCWEWSLYRNPAGYGMAVMRARHRIPVLAHRLSYELHVGPIPPGMTIDHLCFNPPCVNPSHLRVLSPVENSANQRDAYKTHCKRGHEFTRENTRIKRYGNGVRDCKTCHRDRERVARRRRVADIPRVGQVRGERHPNARLTDRVVAEVRRRNAEGETISALAREFEISRSTLQSAIHGKSWVHVPAEPKEGAA